MVQTTSPSKGSTVFLQFEELQSSLEKLQRISRLYGTTVRLWKTAPDCQRLELDREDLATLFDTLAEVAEIELARSDSLRRDVCFLLEGVRS